MENIDTYLEHVDENVHGGVESDEDVGDDGQEVLQTAAAYIH